MIGVGPAAVKVGLMAVVHPPIGLPKLSMARYSNVTDMVAVSYPPVELIAYSPPGAIKSKARALVTVLLGAETYGPKVDPSKSNRCTCSLVTTLSGNKVTGWNGWTISV